MRFEDAAGLARLWGLPVSEVLRGAKASEGTPSVPVAAVYDRHGEVHCIGMDGERIPPPTDMPKGSLAIRCHTSASELGVMDGWTLFLNPPAPGIIQGQFCGIKLASGLATLGIVSPGYAQGRYNILGPGGICLTGADINFTCKIAGIQVTR